MRAAALDIAIPSIARGRYGWAARVPWLPDSADDGARFGTDTLDRGYLNLATAVATAAPPQSSVQLRLLSRRAMLDSQPGMVTACVVATATSVAACRELWDLVTAALPFDLPLESATEGKAKDAIRWVGAAAPETIVEIRRRLEATDPIPGDFARDNGRLTVLPWDVNPNSLRAATELLSDQRGKCVLLLHMQRAVPSEALLEHLGDTFHDIAGDRVGTDGGEYGPMLRNMAEDARERLRMLPRGALHVRVAIASDHMLRPGVAESIGMDLTSVGGFEVAVPHTPADRLDALLLFTEGEARPWQAHPSTEIEELRFLIDPAEASRVVRFPQPPRGGLPGVRSAPMLTLPRSPQAPPMHPSAGASDGKVTLGRCPYGGNVDLTLRELNQHTLVVGLPGFGKTSTLHAILRNLWEQHRVPFLVLDPAKGDYGALIDGLRGHDGQEPQRVVLGPDVVAFNPFVVPAGVATAAHASRILGALDAALQISSHWPMGYTTLTRGVFRAYEQCAPGEYPTLRSVYASVGDIIRTTPLDPKSRADVSGSLLGRLESMVRGPLGAALAAGTDGGIRWDDLLRRPTVIEFRGFAGPTERSLVFGLLIAGLASVREASFSTGPAGQLRHVTVLEEAHRVLADRGAAESEGVRLLAEAIAELRGSGEGFIVVDQAPTGLHPVVRKVCGSLIAHRLVEHDERSTIGSALLLEARQIDDLARLPVGRAVVYGASRVSAVVVDVDRPVASAHLVRAAVRTLAPRGSSDPLFCVGCGSMCRHRAQGRQLAEVHTAPELLTPAFLETVAPDPLWCGIAHATAVEFNPNNPPALLAELQVRRETITRLVTAKNTARKASTEG